jgi:hypothetical protein
MDSDMPEAEVRPTGLAIQDAVTSLADTFSAAMGAIERAAYLVAEAAVVVGRRQDHWEAGAMRYRPEDEGEQSGHVNAVTTTSDHDCSRPR